MKNNFVENNIERMNIVIVGHVDHGKSTIIGKLLADSGSLPQGKLEFVKKYCELNSRPFEYAYLLDALKDEQSQGITIDTARVFFRTEKRHYIIIDAPGHLEFLKNMISGAARAEAALLVIDAIDGVRENSRRHGYMLSFLGIKQVAILINKMDLVQYNKERFDTIILEYSQFLQKIGIYPQCYIPVSGLIGDNVTSKSNNIGWFDGYTLVQVLDNFIKEKPLYEQPFRMPVQDVYKFTANNDTRRIIAGTVESGKLTTGSEIIFYPSGKKSVVKNIQCYPQKNIIEVSAGSAVGFTLQEQIYIKRGEIAVIAGETIPKCGRMFTVTLFWLGKNPLTKEKSYYIKVGTSKTKVTLHEIHHIINASDLSVKVNQERVERYEIAKCTLITSIPIAFDIIKDGLSTSRFVIVDEYEISGGGSINEHLADELSEINWLTHYTAVGWEKGFVTQEEREIKYQHSSKLIIITGEIETEIKLIAKLLEKKIYEAGKLVYFLCIKNDKQDYNSDLEIEPENRITLIRRIIEIANILLDAGLILIIPIKTLSQPELEVFNMSINQKIIKIIWIGDKVTEDINFNIMVPSIADVKYSLSIIMDSLFE